MNKTRLLATVLAVVILGATQIGSQAQAPTIAQQLRSQFRVASVGTDGALRDPSVLVVAHDRIKANSKGYWYNSHHPGKGIAYSALSDSLQPAEIRAETVVLNLGIKVLVRQVDVKPSDVKICVETAPNSNNPAYFACVLFQFPAKNFVQSANLKAIQDSIAEIFVIDTGGTNPPPAAAPPTQFVGKYVIPNTPNVLQLNADGMFALVQKGQSYSGTFTITGDRLMMRIGNRPFAAATMQGDTILDPDGATWVKQQGATTPLKFPSAYVNAQTPSDRLQLNGDNSCSLQEGGQTYRGTFVANGNSLEITIPETNAKTTMTIGANNLTDPGGLIWTLREQSGPTAPSGPALQNEDIVKLAKVGIDDATIIAKIESSKCQFDTSTDALIGLKKSGVSAAVLKAMVGASR